MKICKHALSFEARKSVQFSTMIFFVVAPFLNALGIALLGGSLIAMIIFITLRHRLRKATIRAEMIAHELRTPLLSMKTGAQGIALYLPRLLEAYQLAEQRGLLPKTIRKSHLRQLEHLSVSIIKEVDTVNRMIDLLLMKGKQNEICSLNEGLTETIENYPFNSDAERALVSWQGDFVFQGSKLLLKHLLSNLIKNALKAITVAKKGTLVFWTEKKGQYNILFVKDTALGMSPEQLAQLFQPFYTTNSEGTGLGLPLCQEVMHRFAGDIRCQAALGSYTQFMLYFPLV